MRVEKHFGTCKVKITAINPKLEISMKICTFIFLFIISLLCSASRVDASGILVAWTANTETDLQGYKLYYGNKPGSYPQVVDVGNVTSYNLPVTITSQDQPYYMVLSAYDQAGNESGLSQEMNSLVPSLTKDSDSDGVTDINEITAGTDPNNPADNRPTANAGNDQNIHAKTFALNGSASSDPNQDTLTYNWKQVSGGTVIITGQTTAGPTVEALYPGNYVFALTVNDGKAASLEDQVSIIIVDAAPIADAGISQQANPGTVTLDGSGSYDADGDIISHQWSQSAGPTVKLSSNTVSMPTFTVFKAGRYGFQLIVTAGGLSSQTATTEVIIKNIVPQADAGLKQTVPVDTSVQLHGSGFDLNRDNLSFFWKQSTGPRLAVGLSDAQVAEPLFTPTQSGAYQFELMVKDGMLTSMPDTVDIVVNGVNSVPTADAGLDQVGMMNAEVPLDGSGSSDSDGDVLSFHWKYKGRQDTGVAQVPNVVINDPLSMKTYFVPSDTGVYRFELIVGDGQDYSLADSVLLTINDPSYTVPVANAGADQQVKKGAVVTLGGAESSAYGDLKLSYKWNQTEGPLATLSDPASVSPDFIAEYIGVLHFELSVSDGKQVSKSDDVIIVVESGKNRVPVANAGGKQIIGRADGQVFLDGSKSYDMDEDNLTYFWSQTKGPNVTLSDHNSDKPFFVPRIAQTYEFDLVVSDGRHSSIADSATVVINSIENQAPVAMAGDDQHAAVGARVVLDGSGSFDDDADPLTYKWVQQGGPVVTLTDADTANVSFTPEKEGKYSFILLVNDGITNSQPSEVDLFVSGIILATKIITPDEGTVIVAKGAGFESIELSIPKGSLQHKNLVSIAESDMDLPPVQETETMLNRVVTFEPYDISLNEAVSVTLNFPVTLPVTLDGTGNEQLVIKAFDRASNVWSRIDAESITVGEGFVTVTLNRLSKIAVLMEEPQKNIVDTEVDTKNNIAPAQETFNNGNNNGSGVSGGGCGFIKPTGGSGPGAGGGMVNMAILILPLLYSWYRSHPQARRCCSQMAVVCLGFFM